MSLLQCGNLHNRNFRVKELSEGVYDYINTGNCPNNDLYLITSDRR